jgi:hypothetical protein
MNSTELVGGRFFAPAGRPRNHELIVNWRTNRARRSSSALSDVALGDLGWGNHRVKPVCEDFVRARSRKKGSVVGARKWASLILR